MVKSGHILETIRINHRYLCRISIENQLIAVIGLNPHCGENGFDTKDYEFIAPAISAAKDKGIDAYGQGTAEYDLLHVFFGDCDHIIVPDHDQGHIPMKLVAFDAVINISLGLPIDRTSVDYDTILDIDRTNTDDYVNINATLSIRTGPSKLPW